MSKVSVWKTALRMPRPTPESSSRCFCSKMAAIASSSTTLQLSDGCQPDIVHLSWKSEGKTLANFTKIGIFRRSLGLWGGGSVPLAPPWTPLCCARCPSAIYSTWIFVTTTRCFRRTSSHEVPICHIQLSTVCFFKTRIPQKVLICRSRQKPKLLFFRPAWPKAFAKIWAFFFIEYDSSILKMDFVHCEEAENAFSDTFCHFFLTGKKNVSVFDDFPMYE